MRLWSLHPQYLDRQELMRVWNWAIAACHGSYANHPQLIRFDQAGLIQSLSNYLHNIADEAAARGLRYPKTFKRKYIPYLAQDGINLPVTAGQMEFEAWHYGSVLWSRGKSYREFWSQGEHESHPMFYVVRGAVEWWEKLPPHDYPTCSKDGCEDPIYSLSDRQIPRYCISHRKRTGLPSA